MARIGNRSCLVLPLRRRALYAASTPDATAAAFSNATWNQGVRQLVVGKVDVHTSMQPVADTAMGLVADGFHDHAQSQNFAAALTGAVSRRKRLFFGQRLGRYFFVLDLGAHYSITPTIWKRS